MKQNSMTVFFANQSFNFDPKVSKNKSSGFPNIPNAPNLYVFGEIFIFSRKFTTMKMSNGIIYCPNGFLYA